MTVTAWLRWHALSPLLPPGARRALDIGAGSGSMGSFLAARYDYVGIEPDPVSYAKARQRIGNLGRVLNCGFDEFEPRGEFDLVCAFEVLEHIEDDRAASTEWVRHLSPGGWLLVTVPHNRHRYGAGDARVGHFRRYDTADLVGLFEAAGLDDVITRVYGSPWGNVQEAARNTAFRLRPTDQSQAERTAASGRFLQPPTWAAGVAHAVSAPLAYIQRPLATRGIGTGIVARGRLPRI